MPPIWEWEGHLAGNPLSVLGVPAFALALLVLHIGDPERATKRACNLAVLSFSRLANDFSAGWSFSQGCPELCRPA